ncbi:MAG: hypothetical protein ACPGVF_01490 [Flavobacteriaceae bacterium]
MNYKTAVTETLLTACIKKDKKAQMEAKITGSGDLNCYGHPPLHKTKVTGSGAVHFKD